MSEESKSANKDMKAEEPKVNSTNQQPQQSQPQQQAPPQGQPSQPGSQQGQQPSLQQQQTMTIAGQIQALQQQVAIAQAIAMKEKSNSDALKNFSDRLQADFDNYRKRVVEEKKKLKEEGICEVIERFIPILDVLKQAIMILPENVAEGVKMIYRQINDLFASYNVVEIPALGEMFDPELHNAIMQVKVKDQDKVGMVVEVFQKGYKLGDKILRHSVVKVAR